MHKLRDYQKEALASLYDWFRENEGNPLLVLPTGSGKALLIARICQDALQYPNQRILMLTHIRELIQQNYQELLNLWPQAPVGIYCAGLNKKQHHHQITMASIQSVYKKAEVINFRDLILVDEAHLIGDEDTTMYRSFLAQMKAINPNVRVIGLSATHWRQKSGYLHEGKDALFSAIAYEVPVTRLVKEGYLAPLINKSSVVQADTDKLAITAGEFNLKEMVTEFDRREMTQAAIQEMLTYGKDRKSWLIFCVSIEHAEHVRDALIEAGINAAMVCEKTPSDERARILADFKAGKIRAVTNVTVLTVGFNAPNIDLLVILRATMSCGLLVQMCGRAMRIFPGKENGLILDHGENFLRFGPLTHIMPKSGTRKKKTDRDGKVCIGCRSINPWDATECLDCGRPFEGGGPRKIKHAKKASTAEVMSDKPIISEVPAWFTVRQIHYSIHQKPGSRDTLKVDYDCKPNHVSEWQAPAHTGYPRKKFEDWWVSRGGQQPVPASALEALERISELSGTKVAKIRAVKDGRYSKVLTVELVNEPTEIRSEAGNMNRVAVQC